MGTGCKGKNKVHGIMVSFKTSSLWSLLEFSKDLHALAVLGYLLKLRRVMGLILMF